MTLEEKVGQMVQTGYYGAEVVGPELDHSHVAKLIEEGKIGSILSVSNTKIIKELQHKALKSRLGIPLFFAYDVLHGFKTIFPINLALASTFNPNLIEEVSKVIAFETANSGIQMTFAPMLDTVRDPRWGRVMESFGEDPYLGSIYAKSYVRGLQQGDLSHENSVAACAKHFVAYGLSEGGREYNTVDVSKIQLRNYYLPPFKAAVEEGVSSVMTSFNVVDGVPMTAHRGLVRDLLKGEWNFEGVVVSDYAATVELKHHKTAANNEEVSERSLHAGIDIEMAGNAYFETMELVGLKNSKNMNNIDDAVRRILSLKYEMGLFENPYKGMNQDSTQIYRRKESMDLAHKAALESIVLLKNEDEILPIHSNTKKAALIGPYATNNEVLGFWSAKGEAKDCVTLMEGLLQKGDFDIQFAKGCHINDQDSSMFEEAINVAKSSDLIILALGEDQLMSGEGASRSNIQLPGVQVQLVELLSSLEKPMVVVLFNGRPLDVTKLHFDKNVKAIVESWFLGSESGNALAEILLGHYNPSGKLPMSFPYSVGQIPVYYNHLNTGRPEYRTDQPRRFLSRCIDIPNKPLYPFGHGLSYSNFEFSGLRVEKEVYGEDEIIDISVTIKNNSDISGEVVVQVYIECEFGMVSRPVKELKKIEKIKLLPHQTIEWNAKLSVSDLAFYNIKLEKEVFKSTYNIMVGDSSSNLIHTKIRVV